ARVGAIRRRHESERDSAEVGELRVFFDGRDPQLKGVPLPLPRRERRILEYLVNNRGRRVSKAQIFNSIYGIFDENVEENVVESHISKLRKKLRRQLGYDPINSVRYLERIPIRQNHILRCGSNLDIRWEESHRGRCRCLPKGRRRFGGPFSVTCF